MRGLALTAGIALLALIPAFPAVSHGADDTRLTAILQPAEVLDLSAAADGILSAVHVDLGDPVHAGQVVAELDSSVERATAALARTRAESDSTVRIAEAEVAEASRRLAQREGLRTKGILSEEEYAILRTDLEIKELALARARVEQAVAAHERDRADAILDRRLVRCPIDGVVTERRRSAGELVSNSAQTVILQVADLDPLLVDVQVPVAMLGRISLGSVADLVIEHPEAQYRKGRVTVVGPVADAASATFNVRLEVPNGPGEDGRGQLPSGLRCSVRFRE